MNINNLKLKKLIGVLLLSSLLFVNTGVSADTVSSDSTVVDVESSDNTVTVSGMSASRQKDTEISILATKSETQREDLTTENAADTLVYADQVKTEAGGAFSYNFKLGEEYGTYNIYVYDSFDGGYTKKSVVYQKPSIFRPYGVEVVFENSAGEKMNYLTEDTESVNVKITVAEENGIDLTNGQNANQKVNFVVAVYKNERLTYADVITTGVGECLNAINTKNADVVKIFGWRDTDGMTPFMTEVSIMQYDRLMPKQIVFDSKNNIGTVNGMTRVEDSDADYRIESSATGEIILENSADNTPADAAVVSFDFMTDSEDTSAYFEFISKKADGSERATNNLILRNRRTDVDGEVISPVMQVFKYDQENTLSDENVYGSDYIYRDYGVDLLEPDTEISDKDTEKSSYKQLLHKKIAITPNEWHHIDMCIDYSYGAENGYGSDGSYGRGFVWYYLDGKLLKQVEYWDYYNSPGSMRYSQNPSWAIQDIRSGLKKLKAVNVINRGTGGGVNLKDVKVREIKHYGESLSFENNLEYPEYLDKWLCLKNESIGSSFVGKNINYSAEITNPYIMDGTFSYSLDVIHTDTGTTEQTIKDAFNLAAGETKKVPIAFTAHRYGSYKIKGTATDNLTGRIINIDTDFTVSVKNQFHNPKMMFCDHMTVHYMGTRDAEARLEQLSNIGISGIREDQPYLNGSSVNEGGKYVYDATNANGMNRIVLLTGELWKSAISTEEELESFKANITEVINATKDYNVDYEVYNEYNLYETDSSYTAAAYVKVLKTAYETVKELAPDAKVYGIGAATNMWNGDVQRPSYFSFTEECLKLGAAHYCDGFVIHPYGGGGTSAAQMYDKLITPMINTYKNTRCECASCTAAGKNTYNIDDKEVVITETGYSSKDDKYQAAITLGFLNLIGDEVDRIALYVDMMKEGSTEGENYFGMTLSNHIQFNYPNEPYTPRDSMIALAAFNDLTRGSSKKTITNVLNDTDLKLVKSKYDNGDSLVAFFDTSISGTGDNSKLADRRKTVVLKLTGVENGAIYLYDAYGNETEYTVNTGEISIDVTFDSMPQYIKGKFDGITVK